MKKASNNTIYILLKLVGLLLILLPAIGLVWFFYSKNILFATNIIDGAISFIRMLPRQPGFWIIIALYILWIVAMYFINVLQGKFKSRIERNEHEDKDK
ncbi:hypothetical protein MGH68_18825 [Erysipelothrix sp. D19-032]